MLHKPSVRSTIVPLALALLALIVLNVGLYTRLAPLTAAAAAAPAFSLPYSENYAQSTKPNYAVWGGDWEIRDQTLVQLSTTGYDLGTVIPLKIPADQAYQMSARLHFLGGSMGGGFILNAQQDTSRQKSHLMRFNVDGGKLYIIYGYFGDDSNFVGQGSVELKLDPQNSDWHTLTASVSSANYAISLDDQVLATGIPVIYKGGSVGLISSSSQFAFDDVSVKAIDVSAVPSNVNNQPAVTAAATESPTSVAALPPDSSNLTSAFTDTFTAAGGDNPNWIPFAGKWQYEPGAYVQTDASGFDFGAGSRDSYTAPLRLKVTMIQRQGVGGGVLFNMPQANSKNGATMVRFIDSDTLTWGSFDASGAFNGVGGQKVGAPGTTPHTLEILTSPTSYNITLDGNQIAQNVPLAGSGGHVGLVASQSVVAFTSVQVDIQGTPAASTAEAATSEAATTPQAATTETAANTNVNLNSITGTWTSDGSIFRQTADVKSDAIAGVGIAAEKFRVSVDVLLPDGVADAGGGLVFHMNGRDDAAGGTMVRFSNGGQQIFWGEYDAQHVFKGQGSSPLKLSAGQPHKLTLVVRVADFDILVDDQAVVSNVPLTSTKGWIGLISFRGPVEFTNFELTLSEG